MRIVLIFFSLCVLAGCVTNKKFQYLQHEDVNSSNQPLDSAVRVYDQVGFEYKIQPNDALHVDFKSVTNKTYDFLTQADGGNSTGGGQLISVYSELVDPDGNISFPVLGKVAVGGKTVFQVQDLLQAHANQYLESAVVKVRLVNFRFTLMGEVNAEGTVTTLNNRVTLPEAIGLAGGLTDLANRSAIKIIRQLDGKTQVAYIDILSEDFLASPYYFINQNDVIVVPPLRQRPYRKYFSQNFALVVSSLTLLLLAINITN